jgi:3-oxoacyl-[acyl-carrier protein] reductase
MPEPSTPLAGRTAVVTGSSRRIGKAIAKHLAAAGASVVVNARSSRERADAVVNEITAAGGTAMVHMADVTDEAAVQGLIDAAVAAYGGLDIVVHNAFAPRPGGLAETSLDDWHASLSVILDGAFLCAKYAAPHLEKSGGTIIFIGGATAFEGGTGGPAVPAGKAGLVGLARTLAKNWGPAGATANVLSLGTVGDPTEDSEERTAFHHRTRPIERIPLGRHGTPDNVGAAVVMMCGPGMAYVTGQVIHMTGGYYMG